jgi:hypothetical protein
MITNVKYLIFPMSLLVLNLGRADVECKGEKIKIYIPQPEGSSKPKNKTKITVTLKDANGKELSPVYLFDSNLIEQFKEYDNDLFLYTFMNSIEVEKPETYSADELAIIKKNAPVAVLVDTKYDAASSQTDEPSYKGISGVRLASAEDTPEAKSKKKREQFINIREKTTCTTSM